MRKLMILFAFCVLNAKIYAIVINGINYDLKKNSVAATGRVWYTASVKNFPSYSGDLIIPPYVEYLGNTYTVTAIGISNTEVTSITIPESVTSISCRGCTQLKNINIPEAVIAIDMYAFKDCSSLESIEIPKSIKSIDYDAFSGCTSLTSVYISDITSWCAIDFGNSSSNPLYNACDLYLNGNLITQLVLPEGVGQIKQYAFYGCSSLTSVTIPNSLTNIGGSAFYNCSGLTSVHISDITSWCAIDFGNSSSNPLYNACDLYLNGNLITQLVLPEGVGQIKQYAFYGCSSLTSVTIPNSVTNIGGSAFYNCSSLTSVTIPNSVTNIGGSAFYNCSSLTSVTIPNRVTNIGGSAFYNCSGLTSITIPSSVTNIGKYAFENCTGLTSMTIPNSVTSIGSYAFEGVNNIVYNGTATGSSWGAKNAVADAEVEEWMVYENSTKTKLIGCSSLASGEITIPSSVTTVGSKAFSGCTKISSLNIPSSVTSIGSNAFEEVNNIIYLSGKSGSAYGARNVNKYAEGAFVYADATKQRVLSCSRSTTGHISIPNTVTSISSSAFENCTGLTFITIPNSVTSIEESAFEGCTGLASVNISDLSAWCNINFSYKANPLWYAPNLYLNGELITDLVIPSSVTSIKNDAFYGCSSLTSVTIPNSVTSIGERAFDGCSGLTSVTIPNSVTSIGNGAFGYCSSLTSVIIPNNVSCIGEDAFRYCTSLTTINIPNSVTSIGSGAFSMCTGLTTINIPNSVTSIGSGAFSMCTGLTTVTIPNSVTDIKESAFSGCSGLNFIQIPNTVKSISSYAFKDVNIVAYNGNATGSPWGANNVITDAITYGKLVYENASKSKILSCIPDIKGHLEIPSSVVQIGAKAFNQCQGLTSVYIPNSVLSISKNAFYKCKNLKTVILNSDSIAKKNYTWSTTSTKLILDDLFGEQVNEFIIGDSVKSIGNNAFKSYDNLVSITMSDSITKIGANAFDNCQNLAYVKLPKYLRTIEKEAFRDCTSLPGIYIPDSITSLEEDYIFYGAGATYLILGASIKKIAGRYTLRNTKLQYIISSPITPPSCGSDVFDYTNSLFSIPLYVPIGSMSAYSTAPIWKNFKNIFPIVKAEEINVEGVCVNPSETSVELAWPMVENSIYYLIEIKEGEELVQQLIVNTEGYILNKMNALKNNRNEHQEQNNSNANGLQCIISDLTPSTTYNYTITTLTDIASDLKPIHGVFTTLDKATDINYHTVSSHSTITKFFRDGQIFILRGDKTYTIQGKKVK